MMKDPKELVRKLTQQVGKHEAKRLLVDEGVSTSTADKLVADRYKSEVKELIRKAIVGAVGKAKAKASA
jgi:hypothetical protein